MANFQNIAGIEIENGKFESRTTLNVFKRKTQKVENVSIIYAKNGEGKSTIAKSIYDYANNDKEYINFINKDGETLLFGESDKNNICVFDEAYIDKTVKFKSGGLDTIVLLGKNVYYDNQKEKLNREIEINLKDIEKNKNDLLKCEQELSKWEDTRKKILKDGWAERGKQINGSSKKLSVRKTSIAKILKSCELEDDGEVTTDKFNKLLKEYRRIDKTSSLFDSLNIKLSKYNDEKIKKLLSRKFNAISNVIDNDLFNIENIQKLLNNNDEVCPLCLRKINDEYKIELERKLHDQLGSDINIYQNQLKEIKINIYTEEKKIEEISRKYSFFFEDEVNSIDEKFRKLKENYQIINELIDIKCEKPQEELSNVLNNKLINFNRTYYDCQKEIDKLSNAIKKANDGIKRKENIREALINLNNKLSYEDIKEVTKNIAVKENERQNYNEEIAKLKNSNIDKRNKITEYEEKEENIDLAVDLINENLRCIFLSEKRLYIKYDSKLKNYVIVSKGKEVSPQSISTGEKNIIALAYFFTDIHKKQQLDNNENYFLIIDDPVSSFDSNNKFGIISFLDTKLKEYSNNQNNKILVLTHDYQVINNLFKFKGNSNKKNKEVCRLELKDNQITELPQVSSNSYSAMMSKLYDYLNDDLSDDAELYIGNMARKVFNAYSTFNYRCNIDGLINDEDILSKSNFTDKEREYFKSRRYLVLLNPLSHTENRAKLMDDPYFNEEYSNFDIKSSIRNILIYIYKLSPNYVIKNICTIKENLKKRSDNRKI